MFSLFLSFPAYGNNLKITPRWNLNDHFKYQIEIDEGFPISISKDEKYIKYIFMFSLSVREKTDNFWTLEWQYLPVENTIRECPPKIPCYSYRNDIKQELLIDYTVTSKGIFHNCNNETAMRNQIGFIFDDFAKSDELYKNMDEKTLRILRESIQGDDSLVSELYDFHSIYGNEIVGSKFVKGSPIHEIIIQVTNDYTVNTTLNSSLLIITLNYSIKREPSSVKSKYIAPVIETKYRYKWILSTNRMIIKEMEKNVELLMSDNRKKRFDLRIKMLNSRKPWSAQPIAEPDREN